MTTIEVGMKLDDRYELMEQIGAGGMALVFRATDHRTGHAVAVKILRPEYARDQEFLEWFDREADAASKMTHHNIVNLLDVGQVDNIRYLVRFPYSVQIIAHDPEFELFDTFPDNFTHCTESGQRFAADNLNHANYTLYY